MTDSLFLSLRLIATIGAAMMAGLYFAFSNTIMSSLSKLEPAHGIAAMQSVNRTILNPLFFLLFVGTAASCVLVIVFSFEKLPATNAVLMVIGASIYLLGSLVVTGIFNIPLNNTLENLIPNATGSADWWANFLVNWTTWNHVRTAASIVATVLLFIAKP